MTIWTVPTHLPDLRRVDDNIVAIDTEENDEGLRAGRGSGWAWHGGWICGISFAWREGGEIRAIYIPIRHPDSINFDPAQVSRWLKDHIAAGVRFVTLNGPFDWGWLGADLGVTMPPSNQIEEVGALATLVDENQLKYSLDAISHRCGLPGGKDETLLLQGIEALGLAQGRKKINAREHIWRLPARYVGPYAETDAVRTFEAYEKLIPIIEREGTRAAYRLECDLMSVTIAMRRGGIRIDQDAAEQGRDEFLAKRNAALKELSDQHGALVGMDEINSPKWKVATFERYGIISPRKTPKKGAPSFTAGNSGWMGGHEHWLPRLIALASKYHDTACKFFQGHILDHIIGGKIYAEFHQFKTEDGGTKSLRFSVSQPPLQQMPIRDEETGPPIRRAFEADEGCYWAKCDVSQQEFRILVDKAERHNLPGARGAGDEYRNNPDADYHKYVAEIAELDRKPAKQTNFMKIYGGGAAAIARKTGLSPEKASEVLAKYDAALPFVKQLSQIHQHQAERTGITEIMGGAKRHWNRYEAAWQSNKTKDCGPCSLEEARLRRADPEHPWFGQTLRRAKTYRALNAAIQGDAAIHVKNWMLLCFREGITPSLQIHDELLCNVTTREQGEMIARLGCEAIKLSVPMRVDLKFGRNWADATHSWEELTGAPAPKPKPARAPKSAPAPKPVPKPAADVSERPEPARTRCSPAPAASAVGEPPAAPAAHHNGTNIRDQVRAQSSIAFPAFDVREATTIDLAELIDEPVPKNRKICCRFHAESTPSLHIHRDHFYCFGCHAYGDHIDWLMQVEGLDHTAAQDVLTNWTGPVMSQCAATGHALEEIEQAASDRAYVRRWWDAAEPIRGTLAARYLADTRGIDLDALPDNVDDTLRFHKRCVFGSGVRHPCLIALMRNPISDAPTGIQRIALAPDAQKIDRRMLGTAGVVKLWPAGKQLVVGEGLETTLAAATRLPYRDAPLQPAWAALSNGALKQFPIVSGVERLVLLADNDANNAGAIAAEACKQRWLEAGRRVALLMPDRPGADFNDIVLANLERAP